MNLTQAEVDWLEFKYGPATPRPVRAEVGGDSHSPVLKPAKVVARPSEMNKTEARYAERLKRLVAEGEVLWWAFEAVKLKLAPATYYTVDFLVVTSDFTLEAHETKGFMRDDAAVKLKVAAKLFPFVFRLVKWSGKAGWTIKAVTGKV